MLQFACGLMCGVWWGLATGRYTHLIAPARKTKSRSFLDEIANGLIGLSISLNKHVPQDKVFVIDETSIVMNPTTVRRIDLLKGTNT